MSKIPTISFVALTLKGPPLLLGMELSVLNIRLSKALYLLSPSVTLSVLLTLLTLGPFATP